MNITGIRRRAGALAVVGGMVMGATLASAGSAQAVTDYQIGTFNMAGGHDTHGPKGNEAPDALVESVKSRKPGFVVLQEACRDWTDRLGNELRDYEYTVTFDPVQKSRSGPESTSEPGPTAKCKHPSDFGNAILYRNNFGIDAVDPGRLLTTRQEDQREEQREMLCVRAEAKKIVVCSLHLSQADKVDARRTEAREAKHILAKKYAGYTQFVGGDLNDGPSSAATDNFYHRDYGYGAHGELKEVDSPCGNDMKPRADSFPIACRRGETTSDDWPFGEDRPTGGKKIDYIFVSPSVKVRWGDATTAIHSDHDPLWAGVNF